MEELVSIITPSYNTARFIAKTIESVLAQTYKSWEMIIVDDCSTDNTDKVVEPYLEDKRIRYLKNEKNSGAAISRNYALREAKGKWIAFLDSDDLWLPEKLEKQIAFMKNNSYYFSCCATTSIDEEGNPSGIYTYRPHHVGVKGMYFYCWPGCLGTMYDADVVGLIQIADLKKNNDYAMWLKVIKKCDFYGFDEVLAVYRVRKQSISHDDFRKLVKSHYDLFHIGEKMSPIRSIFYTGLNLVGGFIKKHFFKKQYKRAG